MSPSSGYHRLSAALDAYIDHLPAQLEFSPQTLQVHFSTRSSSSYSIMHITLFLARITLERKCIPELPFASTRPMGPHDPPKNPTAEEGDFFARSAERMMAASRDLISVFSFLEDWNAKVESPFIISALERAVKAGIYAYNFPWMDTRGYLTGVSWTGEEPMGTGEETRKAVEFVKALSKRWVFAKESYNKLVDLQSMLTERVESHIRHDNEGDRFAEKLARYTPNSSERVLLFELLSPPAPKHSGQASSSSHHRGLSSEVDTLLMAASGVAQDQATAPSGSERWMAVNTHNTNSSSGQQQQAAMSHKSEEGGLDTLAGFAAQQGKIGNGQESYGTKINEPSVKKEDEQHTQPGEDRRWTEMPSNNSNNNNNWVNALEG